MTNNVHQVMINDQVSPQVIDQVWFQVWFQVYDQVNLQVRDHIWKQFEELPNDQHS